MYKSGDECVVQPDSREYQLLKKVAKKLNQDSSNKHKYYVKDVYLDYGQDWMWTTICDETAQCQVLSPRQWKEILNEEKSEEEFLKDFFEDEFCQDKPGQKMNIDIWAE